MDERRLCQFPSSYAQHAFWVFLRDRVHDVISFRNIPQNTPEGRGSKVAVLEVLVHLYSHGLSLGYLDNYCGYSKPLLDGCYGSHAHCIASVFVQQNILRSDSAGGSIVLGSATRKTYSQHWRKISSTRWKTMSHYWMRPVHRGKETLWISGPGVETTYWRGRRRYFI